MVWVGERPPPLEVHLTIIKCQETLLMVRSSFPKHAHIENFLVVKMNIFTRNIFDIFSYFCSNIDCGYTLELPCQSMFWSKNKKNRYTPAYPSFAI